MTFRKTVFWAHLAAGVVAGIVIGIMSFTGAALAFEKEIIALAERDARWVTPPTSDAKPLPLDELLRRIHEARPDFRFTGFVLSADPHDAIALSAGGRGGGGNGQGAAPSLYANPYTGEVREAQAPRTRAFLRAMNSWHRWLGVEGEHRNIARAATGASNAAFCFLAVSGLFLWWPRKWRTKGLKRSLVFLPGATGKARDWNWHNVIGLWSSPVLIVLTLTALPMSYRWASDGIYKLAGTPLLAQGQGSPGGGGGNRGASAAGTTFEISKPFEGAQRLGYDALVASVQKEIPTWVQITLRTSGVGGDRGPRAEGGARREGGANAEGRPAPEARDNVPVASTGSDSPAVMITVRDSASWPRTATTTLSLDPYTGAIIRRTGYADQNPAQRVRAWTRFLHTGEALGWIGQLVAGLASLGGVVLMYTGFALAWHRFFIRPKLEAKSSPAVNHAG